ncbi:MAG: hypothetical protein ACXVPL_00110 [Actinomycetota bacterium]
MSASMALMLGFAVPASAGVPRTTEWFCLVPEDDQYVGVVFVAVPERATGGITQADSTAGETFGARFGEICSVR